MKNFDVEINKAINNIKPYEIVSSYHEALKNNNSLKLDWNEGTISPSPKVIEALIELITKDHLNWYADPTCTDLVNEIKKYTKLAENNILVTNGSDAGLELIARVFLNSNDKVLIPQPTYSNFEIFTATTGCSIEKFVYKNPFELDKELLIKNLEKNVKIVYLVNPNNPTGLTIDLKILEDLLNLFPKTIFLIDEAYYEFAKITAVSFIDKYKNLIIARSFSKAFCLAGVRIGYILSCSDIIDKLKLIHNFKSVNVFAQVAAKAALKDIEYTDKYIDEINKSKKWLSKKLNEISIYNIITPANFILLKFNNPVMVQELLKKELVFVRNRSNLPGLRGFLRITIGTIDQMEKFFNILKEILEQNKLIN